MGERMQQQKQQNKNLQQQRQQQLQQIQRDEEKKSKHESKSSRQLAELENRHAAAATKRFQQEEESRNAATNKDLKKLPAAKKKSRFALEPVGSDDDAGGNSDEEPMKFNTSFSFEDDSGGLGSMGGSLFGSFSQLNPRKMVRNASMQAAVERARVRLKGSGSGAADDSGAESDAGDVRETHNDGNSDNDSSGGANHDGSSDEDAVASTKSSKKAEAAAAAAALHLENRKAQEAEFFDDSFTFSSGGDSFPSLHLSRPLLRAVTAAGYDKPTQIQRMVIPVAMEGRDVCAAARTGSGKTAAFVLPILERLMHRSRRSAVSRVLILLPTRELATQCAEVVSVLGKFTDVRCCCIIGGVSLSKQEIDLRAQPEVIVATPGRLIDLLRNSQGVTLECIEILVLDEADRLLEMGFEAEITQIISACPVSRQTLLLSATMTNEVAQLVKLSLRRPVRLNDNAAVRHGEEEVSGVSVPTSLRQEFIRIRAAHENTREAVLLALLSRTFTKHVIVFAREKRTAHRLRLLIGLAGLSCCELHGNLSQEQRMQSLEDFKEGRTDILVATDIASRGIDVPSVDTVINFEAPKTLSEYIHRVGRTARAGRRGCACTIADDGPRTRDMMKQVVAHARSAVKKRVVAVEAVEQWQAKLLAFEGELEKIKEEEVVERHLALAEMEAAKAHNLLRHEDEIKAKPRRTWFQSEKEKAEVKKAGKGGSAEEQEEQDDAGAKRFRAVDPKQLNKYSGMSRDKRRRLILQGDDPRELKTLGKVAPVKGAKELGREAKADSKLSKKKDRTGFDFEKQGKGPRADKEKKIVKPLKKGELKRTAAIEKRPDRRPEHKKGPKTKPSNKSFKSKGRHKRR